MKTNMGYALPKKNLMLLAVGFLIILVGFVLMIGGGAEGTEFNPEIYNTQRVTVGPMIALFGFIFEIFVILWVPENEEKEDKKETGLSVSEKEDSLTVKF
ncbi:MAG: DUF3098 domain-containing protein [Paludibacteraceae bacterium]|nr:DUF3098 domain-containing protein [Paludibacteraceae bacterium]